MNHPEISVIIVSWNTADLLAACLRSVYDSGKDLSIEIFVVDNHSSDGSPKMVRDLFPDVRLIENAENRGFAAANNQVLPLCSAPAIMLLNSDTLVRQGAFQTLLNFLKNHPEAMAIGPKLVHPRVKLRILGAGRQPTLRTVVSYNLFLSSLFPRIAFFEGVFLFLGKHDDRARKVEWLCGACLVVRKKAVEIVGPLSETYFMYCEDMEWCDRMFKLGWALYHVPDAVVEHHLSASTSKNEKALLLPITTAREYFISRNRPNRLSLLIHDLARTIGLIIRAGGYFAMSFAQSESRSMWRGRARQFLVYARATLRDVIDNPKGRKANEN